MGRHEGHDHGRSWYWHAARLFFGWRIVVFTLLLGVSASGIGISGQGTSGWRRPLWVLLGLALLVVTAWQIWAWTQEDE